MPPTSQEVTTVDSVLPTAKTQVFNQPGEITYSKQKIASELLENKRAIVASGGCEYELCELAKRFGLKIMLVAGLLLSVVQLGFAQTSSYLSAIDVNQAWGLVGESIYRTPDGGQTLESISRALVQVSAIDYNTAWAVDSSDAIYRTRDGGQTWEVVNGLLKHVSALDYNTAWGVNSSDQIWRTLDGGLTWENIATNSLKQVSAVDYNAAWGVDANDAIFRTANGGQTWESVPGSLKQVSALDYNMAWGVNSADQIWRTADGGLNWENTTGLLRQVSSTDYNTAWGVSSDEQLWRTPDGGQTWENIAIGQQVVATPTTDTSGQNNAATPTPTDTGNTGQDSTITSSNVSRVEVGPGDGTVTGYYEQTSPTTWVEKDVNGNITFYFDETSRDASSVYLFDGSRAISIILDLGRNIVGYSDSTGAAFDLYTINSVYAIPIASNDTSGQNNAADAIVADPQLSPAQASSVPSQFTGDLESIFKNGIEWSASSRVFDSSLGGFTETYGSRDGVSYHINGIAYTQSKRLVINHSLEEVAGDSCGSILAYSTPYIYARDNEVTWTMTCLSSWHPSMMHAAENIVAVTDSSLRFFEFDSSPDVPIRELTHLTIKNKYDAVAFAYRQQDKHYYVMTANLSDEGYVTIRIWRDSSTADKHGPPCASLADTTCRFVIVGTIDNVYASSSGMGLVDQPDGKMILMAMYSAGADADHITATEIDIDTLTAIEIGWEYIGITQVQVYTTRPSCRWGCSVNVVDGQLFILWAGRDLGNLGDMNPHTIDEFEMAIHMIENPTKISVSIATANVSGGGTDSNITLTIHGTTRNSAAVDITSLISGDALEYGTTDTIAEFPLSQAIGDPIAVTLQTDYSYPGAAWLPEWVEVTIGEKTLTVYNTKAEWLDDYEETLRLDSTGTLAATTATVSIATADDYGAGTDSNITVTIHGGNGDSPAIVINPYLSGDALEAGTTDSTSAFPLGKDIGTPTTVTLKTDYSYPGAAWLPSVVTVIIGGQTYTANNSTDVWLDDYDEILTLTLTSQ